MQTLAAVLVGKLISFLTRTLGAGGGSAAPGLYALKIDPDLVRKLSAKITTNIVITGTNGKTTTARMLAHFAKEFGSPAGLGSLKVIRNHTGSNLERGIASTLISNYQKLTAENGSNLGIWELDEAAFNTVAPKIKPDIVVFLNVFRDQLDRYGEVDSVVKGWTETLKKLDKKMIVLVNGDDINTNQLAQYFKGKVQKFGVKNYKITGEGIKHKKEVENLDFEAKDVKLKGLNGSSFQLSINKKLLTINSPLPGLYHIYDTVAAIACASILGLPINKLTDQLISFLPAFGRVEKLPFGYIFLIKNPVGATQVFQTIASQIKPQDRLLLALNDNLADGTDVSWIWDANFEQLTINDKQSLRSNDLKRLKIICSGTRAYDLANRLKYAGFNPKHIIVVEDLPNALKEARKALKGSLFILPTYTAMLRLQGILAKMGIKEDYWKESE